MCATDLDLDLELEITEDEQDARAIAATRRRLGLAERRTPGPRRRLAGHAGSTPPATSRR